MPEITGLTTGGSTILSYNLQMNSGGSSTVFTSLTGESPDSLTWQFMKGGLITDQTYTFRYWVWNIHGWSPFSSTVTILCSTKPAQPISAPSVSIQDNVNVLITWLKPDDGGNYISAYKIFIQKIDGTYD